MTHWPKSWWSTRLCLRPRCHLCVLIFDRVRRADLASRQSSVGTGSENVELEARFRQQVQHTHETSPQIGISAQGPSQDEGQSGQVVDEDPVEYDFRLFSKPAVSSRQEDSAKHIQKIALRSPTPDVSESGFVTAQRPNNFYFTGAPSPCRVQKYSEIAISGEDVLRGLKIRHVSKPAFRHCIAPAYLSQGRG